MAAGGRGGPGGGARRSDGSGARGCAGALTGLSALTSKPVLYVANVAEGEPLEPPPALVEYAEALGARATAVSARLDAELSELADEDASAMRDELGVEESGLETSSASRSPCST